MDLDKLTDRQLLELHCSLMAKLRQRGVVRSSNNPVADYTETLVAKALGAELANSSTAGYDAVSANGTRYQIKGRRLTPENASTQLSAIRNLAGEARNASHPRHDKAEFLAGKEHYVITFQDATLEFVATNSPYSPLKVHVFDDAAQAATALGRSIT